MSNLDNFKKFVSNHPEFVDYVRNNNVSWQNLYELYDIYGENEAIWAKYTGEGIKSNINIKSLLNSLKNINIDSLEENISSIQKAISLVSEFTKSSEIEKGESKESNLGEIFNE